METNWLTRYMQEKFLRPPNSVSSGRCCGEIRRKQDWALIVKLSLLHLGVVYYLAPTQRRVGVWGNSLCKPIPWITERAWLLLKFNETRGLQTLKIYAKRSGETDCGRDGLGLIIVISTVGRGTEANERALARPPGARNQDTWATYVNLGESGSNEQASAYLGNKGTGVGQRGSRNGNVLQETTVTLSKSSL